MSSELLDDYEEGSWTPSLRNGGSATVTYGHYTKIGRQVTVLFYLSSISISGASAAYQIQGLPYTVSSGHGFGNMGYVHNANYGYPLLPVFSQGNDYIYFHRQDGTVGVWNYNDAVNTNWGTSYLLMGGTYFTAT